MQVEVAMEGYSPDRVVTVRCALKFDPDNFSVSRQGFGRLLFLPYRLENSLAAYQPNSPYVGGKVDLVTVSGWLGSHNTSWNLAIPQIVSPDNQQSLVVSLQDRDLEALEDVRAGGDLNLNISLSGLARVTAGQAIFVSAGQQWKAVQHFPSSTVPVASSGSPQSGNGTTIHIRRERWLELLKQAGRTRMLVELPMPKLPNIKPWEEVARLLNVAETYHRSGDFEAVPEKCREVFEGLLQFLAGQWNVPKPTDDSFERWTKEVVGRLKSVWPEKDVEQADTLALLLNAGRLWSRSSHHFGAGIPKREESAFILHLTTNLFGFCVQLAEAFPDPLVQKQ